MNMFIVITLPHFFDGEAEAIIQKFQCGLQRLHLRKPESTADECRALLRQIPACYHSRIVIHDHFELTEEFGLLGVHLNRRNPMPPVGWKGGVSCSCHSLEELKARKAETWSVVTEEGVLEKTFDYLSLSPIFDSISKTGYMAAFTPEQLRQAHADGIIDERVMALGGICHDNVEEALSYGFGGVMVLGDAWRETPLPFGGGAGGEAVVLTIAGSDPSAGAGIQQDLKTITNCGVYGATVITALTSQNTMGVQGVMPVPADVVESQLRSVFSDLSVSAVKIGMIPNLDVARVIVKVLEEERRKSVLPIVCDPVMVSTSGRQLMDPDCVDYVVRHLFPLCTLATPNIPELEYLQSHTSQFRLPDMQADSSANAQSAQFSILNSQFSILKKGGHADGDSMDDILFIPIEGVERTFSSPRIATKNLHGTGCTLSSAIASQMALGHSLVPAVEGAKRYVTRAIEGGRDLHIGHGNGPLWYV
ncbi:MAG: bifunctional hydroxymethylpyrimidine kinase/phosphomethylpyrimidine kinase [Bacteroidales bacterium]|nr:bifunctional hydroxymethylpyrimidine kinase/phosphomethylpyrimidine kinase [Bacteroidales bacterium]